jgi:predicted RNA binding protein YcfA (HicA-like mRNA interferase family)
MKARQMLRLLGRIGYVVDRQQGSHRMLVAEGRPRILFAYHDGVTIGRSMVRDILVKQAGLTLDEAREVIRCG